MKRLIVALVVLTSLITIPSLTSAQSAKDYYDKGTEISDWVIADFILGEVDEKNYEKSLNEAIWNFNKAIELNPRYAEAYYKRGLCYRFLEKHNQAINDYTRAIELNPKYSFAYYNRGLTYKKLGNYEQAKKDLETAKRLGYDPEELFFPIW